MLRIIRDWVAANYSTVKLLRLPIDRICDFTTTAALPQTPQRPVASISLLPAELIENIFDHLPDDKESITACTLVCQDWRVLAQPRLFHRTVLSTEDIQNAIEFQRFLLRSPNIRAGVRELTIHFLDFDYWAPNRRLALNLMADVLELLPRPESLRLYGPRMSDNRIKWTRLSNHMKNSIRILLRRPSMSHLLIDGWLLDVNQPEFNKIFETASHSLTSISLLDISDGIWGTSDIPPPPAARMLLDKLTVSNTFTKDHKFVEWLCRPESIFDLQGLKTLHVVESRDDEVVSLLASTIGESLERLEVNISYTAQEFIDLGHSAGLRSLRLTFGVAYTELYYSCIPWLCETLDTIPHDNQIQEISLSLYITHPRNTNRNVFPPPPIGRFNYDRWERLGTVLSGPKFAYLGRVNIELIHHGIDARGYSMTATQRLGDIGSKTVWKYLRDDSPDVDGTQEPPPP